MCKYYADEWGSISKTKQLYNSELPEILSLFVDETLKFYDSKVSFIMYYTTNELRIFTSDRNIEILIMNSVKIIIKHGEEYIINISLFEYTSQLTQLYTIYALLNQLRCPEVLLIKSLIKYKTISNAYNVITQLKDIKSIKEKVK